MKQFKAQLVTELWKDNKRKASRILDHDWLFSAYNRVGIESVLPQSISSINDECVRIVY